MIIYQLNKALKADIPEKFHQYLKTSETRPEELYITSHTLDYIGKTLNPPISDKILSSAVKLEISPPEMESIEHRTIFTIESILSDAPSQNAIEEIKLILWLEPTVSIRYLGRANNKQSRIPSVFRADIIGGKRQYYWQQVTEPSDPKEVSPFERYHELRKWFLDKDARIVLCLGGGGTRMCAATPLLKILDILEVRSNISEIWGSSGGAMVGMPYSLGIAPQWIDQIGYDFYSNRYPELGLKGLHFSTFALLARNLLTLMRNFRLGIIDFRNTFRQAMEKALDHSTEGQKKIPFFAISQNVLHGDTHVLTEKENIKDYHQSLMCPCELMQAMFASTAIPFLFKPELISMPSGQMEYWHDGCLSEEVPLVSPYLKWQLDLKNDPHNTPKNFKIFYLHLGARCSEFEFMKKLPPSSSRHRLLGNVFRIIDRNLDINEKKAIALLESAVGVEVLGTKICIGLLGVLDVRKIPEIIIRSRKFLIRSLDRIENKLNRPKTSRRKFRFF